MKKKWENNLRRDATDFILKPLNENIGVQSKVSECDKNRSPLGSHRDTSGFDGWLRFYSHFYRHPTLFFSSFSSLFSPQFFILLSSPSNFQTKHDKGMNLLFMALNKSSHFFWHFIMKIEVICLLIEKNRFLR